MSFEASEVEPLVFAEATSLTFADPTGAQRDAVTCRKTPKRLY